MAKNIHPEPPGEVWPDRKAHASLAHVEKQALEGLKSAHPDLVDAQGQCPDCVSLQHSLADPSLAEQTAREFS